MVPGNHDSTSCSVDMPYDVVQSQMSLVVSSGWSGVGGNISQSFPTGSPESCAAAASLAMGERPGLRIGLTTAVDDGADVGFVLGGDSTCSLARGGTLVTDVDRGRDAGLR